MKTTAVSFAGAMLLGIAASPVMAQVSGPVLPRYVGGSVRDTSARVGDVKLRLGAQPDRDFSVLCGAAELVLGVAGSTAGFAGARAAGFRRGPTVVGVAAGAVGGVILASRVGGCRASVRGALAGAALNILASYAAGSVVASGQNPEGWGRSFAYVGMAPLAVIGAQLRW